MGTGGGRAQHLSLVKSALSLNLTEHWAPKGAPLRAEDEKAGQLGHAEAESARYLSKINLSFEDKAYLF